MTDDLPPGSTPLTPAEEAGLIPSHITTRGELNELEQANILEATSWLFTRRAIKNVSETTFLKELHRRLFGQVWRWAGQYRKEDRNIGVHWPQISYEVEKLCAEVSYWIENRTYSAEEIAVRFHHKLVWIHCFPNGNGRHARLAADLLVVQLQGERFTWGSTSLDNPSDVRSRYIESLRNADEHDYDALLRFVRT